MNLKTQKQRIRSREDELPTKEEWALFQCFRDKIWFRENFILESGVNILVRYYQMPPGLCENLVWVGGRKTGKSFDLEIDPIWYSVNYPYKKTLVTTLSEYQLPQRMKAIYLKLQLDPVLNLFIKNKKESPTFSIWLTNESHIEGVIAGKHQKGENVLSRHVHRILIDETQLYNLQAYQNLANATAEAETALIERLYGVPDNRMDTPFAISIADVNKNSFKFRIPAWTNPFFNKAEELRCCTVYKGRETAGYKANVKAEESEVSGGAWDWDDISVNFSRDKKGALITAKVFEIDKKDIELVTKNKEVDIKQLLPFLPPIPDDSQQILMGMDVGRTIAPSEIVIFSKNEKPKYQQICRIHLTRAMYSDQALIVDYLLKLYGGIIAIDATGAGVSVLDIMKKFPSWDNLNYKECVYPVVFHAQIPTNILKNEEENFVYKNGQLQFETRQTKTYLSEILFTMFHDKKFELPNDPLLQVEFCAEVKKAGRGFEIFDTTSSDHVIDAFRCFAYLIYLSMFKDLTNKISSPPPILTRAVNITI